MAAAGDEPEGALEPARRHRSGIELALLAISKDYLALGGTPLAGAGGRPQHGPIRSPQ